MSVAVLLEVQMETDCMRRAATLLDIQPLQLGQRLELRQASVPPLGHRPRQVSAQQTATA